MSLARALTTRRKERAPASAAYMGRAASQRAPNAKPIKRAEISLPVALVSTTNMLSYEAPNITDAHHVQHLGGRYFSNASTASSPSIGSSGQSDNESDHTGSIRSYHTDATSVEMPSPDPSSDNHYHNFFKSSSAERSTREVSGSRLSRSSTLQSERSRPSLDQGSPQIPQRAPSHSIKAHQLSHKRSLQRMTVSSTNSIGRHSIDQWRPAPPVAASSAAHPFGKELEQLNEAAEEFGLAMRSAESDADSIVMRAKGLVRFCAADYMSEISSMYSTRFDEDRAFGQHVGWI